MLHTVKSRYFEDEPPVTAEPTAPIVPTLAAAAAVVALGFLGSRLLGLLRTVVIAHQFGTTPELDAYFVAFRLPDLIFQLLAGATLGSAFIPTFARTLADKGEEAGWRLAASVLNLVFAATLIAAVIGLLLAPLLVPATAPGLGDDAGQSEQMTSLAVDLTRIMMISPILFAVSGMFMGILNARHNFFASALAPMFYNVAIIVGALLSDDVRVLAFAVVIGALLHMLVQIPSLINAGMRWQPLWDWRDAAVREVGRLMGPRVIGLAAYHLNFVIATFFASTVGDGAISAVNYAWLIVMTPLGLFGMAISTAIFPRLAEQATRDEEELRRSLSRALRLILYLTIPATIGLMVIAGPLTALLLRSGAFDASSSDLVVGALVLYALGLFAHSGIEILSRGFYALADTRTPVTFSLVAMAVNLVLCLALVRAFEVNGLALALSVAAIVEFGLLARALAERLRGLDNARLARSVTTTVAASLLMAELVGLWLLLLRGGGLLEGSDKLMSGVAVAGALVIGVPVFYGVTRLLGSQEAVTLAERLPLPAGVRRLAGVQGTP